MEVFWAIFGMLKNLQEILSSGVGISDLFSSRMEMRFASNSSMAALILRRHESLYFALDSQLSSSIPLAIRPFLRVSLYPVA